VKQELPNNNFLTISIFKRSFIMKLYVGNLDREVTQEDLKDAFSPYGELGEVTVIKDRATNVSKGFGFVEMPKKSEGDAAITGMQGKDLKGRSINVNEARPKTEGSSRGGFGGGGFGGGNREGGNRRY
jgi:RNA recognition motif-containing protein